MWAPIQRHNWIPNPSISRSSWSKRTGKRDAQPNPPGECEWPSMNSNVASHRARRPLALDRPMFEKLMTNPHADLGGYQCAVRFVNALACMSEIEPLEVIWRLVSPSQFGMQRLRQIFMISQVNLFTNDNTEIVNTLVMPVLKAIVNTPARYDPAARTSLQTLLKGIWAVPFLMQRLLEVLSVRKLEDTESLVLFLLCSVYLDVVKSDVPEHWNYLQKLVESLLHQGVNRAERISNLIQRKPGEGDCTDLSLGAIENQPGGRHANDFYDFKRIQITPIPDEIDLSKSSDNTFLPMANGEDGFLLNDPALRMVDRSFRLLREDMVSMLRDNLAKPTPIVFSNVCVEEFELRPQPCAILSFDAPTAVQKLSPLKRKEFWRKSRWLAIGSLVCIAKERQPIVFGEIIHRQFASERNLHWNDQPEGEDGDFDIDDTVEKRYVIGIAVENEKSFNLLAGIQPSNEEFELLQGCFNFFSYKPVLEALQCSSDFPFYQHLVAPSKFDPASVPIDDDSMFSALTEFGESPYEQAVALDAAQKRAFAFGVDQNEKLALIQGPPGTGKTLIGVLIALALSTRPFTRILCVCYTNHQLDQFLEALLDAGMTDIVRIGGRCSSDRLSKYILSHRAGRARPPTLEGHYRGRLHDVYQLLKELENDIEELTSIISRPIVDWPFFNAHLDPEMTSQFFLEDFGDDTLELGSDGQVIRNSADLWRNWRLGQITSHPSRQKYFLWTLNHQERLALLKTWQEEIRVEQMNVLSSKFVQYKQLLEERISINQKNELPILMKAKVIGCTATGAAKYRALLNDVKCDVIILEEAAELLEASVLGSINVYTEKLVMIGDHMQLRPKINNHRLSVESENGLDLNRSTFERLIVDGHPYVSLQTQHRMRPEISSVVRRITYHDLLDGASVLNFPHLKGLKSDLIFVNHLGLERTEQTISTSNRLVRSTSKVNPLEAKLVVGTALYLCQQGYRTDQVVILTPYLGQLLEIREVLSRAKIDVILGESDQAAVDEVYYDPDAAMSARSFRRPERNECSIRVSTVDNFQGQQADIVLVSLVRNNPNGRIGFLKQPERINVLLTRSRYGLILFGNRSCLEDACPIWQKVIESFRVTDGIPAVCPRHDIEMLVRDHVDFVTLTPHGGCSNICEAELPCGHRCQSPCHDPAIIPHAKCSVRFPDKCPDGHKIMRPCRQGSKIPKCRQQVVDICPECTMQIVRKCYVPIYEAKCFNCEIEASRRRALLQIETEKVRQFASMMEDQAKKLLDIEMENARLASDLTIKKTEQSADMLLHKALADKKKAELDAIQTCQKIATDVACEIRKCHEDAEKRRLDEQARIDRLVKEAQRTSATLKAAHEAIIQHSQEVALEEVATLEADRDKEAARIRETLRLAEDLRNMSMNVCCGICFEDYKRSDCVACPSIDSRPDQMHFFCRECFSQLVLHESDGDIRLLALHGGMIICPYARAAECVSPAFTDATIAKWVPAPVFEQYMKSKEKVLEKTINDEFEQNFPARLELEIKRRAEEAPVLVRRKIIEFLTPACPRCHAAFIDFDGCAALTCHNCPCRFCAFCLHDCGDDAHAHVHVANCKFNPTANVYVSVEVWKDAHRRWIYEQIVAVLQGLSYSQIPQALKDCEKELIDLNIDPQTLVAALKVHKYSQ